MKPRIRAIAVLILSAILAVNPVVRADTRDGGMDSAAALYSMGLFRGTEFGFELDRTPTRLEGAVMFVRLLGAEGEALGENYPHPFGDVPSWGSPYVGYLYHYGLTNGISALEFGAALPLRDIEYMTIGLRALGYKDKGDAKDFSWDMSISYAYENNILSPETMSGLAAGGFTRGDVADISMELLKAYVRESPDRLIDRLVGNGSIPYNSAGAVFPAYATEKRYIPSIDDPFEECVIENRAPVSSFMSRYGFLWNMFGMDYANYIQIGEQSGIVTGILAASRGYGYEKGIETGMDIKALENAYGGGGLEEIIKPLSANSMLRQILDNTNSRTYLTEEGDYITYFLDSYENNEIIAFLVIKKETEESMTSYFNEPDSALARDMGTQVYHLTNAVRFQKGMDMLAYSQAAGEIAKDHSKDMAANGYFSHVDSSGRTIGTRAADRGIPYVYVGENLSYGYNDPMRMVNGWMNSNTGHRDTLLGDFVYIGVGVAFNEDDVPLCTQDYWR